MMTVRIIDHKRVEMTDDEWKLYEKICRSYDRPNFEGKSLFEEHFEVDGNGIIIFVLPAEKKRTSFEVYSFLVSLMINQHLRVMRAQVESLIREGKQIITDKVKELDDKLKELNATGVNSVEESAEK
jgi:hypothetical protein